MTTKRVLFLGGVMDRKFLPVPTYQPEILPIPIFEEPRIESIYRDIPPMRISDMRHEVYRRQQFELRHAMRVVVYVLDEVDDKTMTELLYRYMTEGEANGTER